MAFRRRRFRRVRRGSFRPRRRVYSRRRRSSRMRRPVRIGRRF